MAIKVGDRTLAARIVASSQATVTELAQLSSRLGWNEECGADPRLYIASVSQRDWTPRVIAVWEGTSLLGLVYLKERKVARLNTGLLLADGSVLPVVLSDPVNRENVLCAAIQYLFSRASVRGVRMLIPADGPEMSAVPNACSAISSVDVEAFGSSIVSIGRLALPSTYEEFLAMMGNNTRRNFRRYRRRSEERHNRYVEPIPCDEFAKAVAYLSDKCTAGGTPSILLNPEKVRCGLRVLAAAQRPLLAGLRGPDGQWLAVLGAWCGLRKATVVLQLNDDSGFPHDSLSVVLRSYVIEGLIARGVRSLLVPGGLSGPLVAHCSDVPLNEIHLDARTRLWRLFRYSMARITRLFPDFRSIWIAPPAAGRVSANRLTKPPETQAA